MKVELGKRVLVLYWHGQLSVGKLEKKRLGRILNRIVEILKSGFELALHIKQFAKQF